MNLNNSVTFFIYEILTRAKLGGSLPATDKGGGKTTGEHSLDRIIQSRSPLQSNPIHQLQTRDVGKQLVDEMTEAHEGLSLLWKHPSSLPATDMEDQCGTNGVSYVTDCMAPTPEQPSA